MGYDGAEYSRPELRWTQSSFVQPQMMIEDRYFYDPAAGRYTVDRYLDDLEKRYGGIDSVLVWHTYPNIGIDNRNQYDLLRDMPGGAAGRKQMVADFHRRGVRVLFPVMLWDQGTRDARAPNWVATAEAMAEIGADGINGDTLAGVPRAFRAASDEIGHPLALEPEGGPADEALAWNNFTWGYWKYPFVPMISKYKWLEPRHVVHVSDRWNRDKTDNLQYAFFNGVGYESWENIWGIWNQITPRDAEALRRIAKIERAFAGLLAGPEWEPHTPMLRYGVFASRWPARDLTLWTIVNRNEYGVKGRQIEAPYPQEGRRYYDLWHGMELKPEVNGAETILSFDLEARGYGAVLGIDAPPGANFALDRNVAKLLAEVERVAGSVRDVLTADMAVQEEDARVVRVDRGLDIVVAGGVAAMRPFVDHFVGRAKKLRELQAADRRVFRVVDTRGEIDPGEGGPLVDIGQQPLGPSMVQPAGLVQNRSF